MKKVVIVVPVYKKHKSILEEISSEQLFEVLGGYDIFYIGPKRIKDDNDYTNRDIKYFDDYWFENRLNYSKLCLDDRLYAEFSDYEYMLIYQLDAFVFSDELEYFCSLGFDYIGAPHSQMSAIKMSALYPSDEGFYVGNGGFSLRNVNNCRKVLKQKDWIYSQIGEGYFDAMEDSFFTYCGLNHDIDFSIPSVRDAVKFSIQGDADFFRLKEMLNGSSPFGTHAWHKDFCYPLLYPYIRKALGNKTDRICIKNDLSIYKKYREKSIINYFRYRIEYDYPIETIKSRVLELINVDNSYLLWGYGVVGKWVYSFFDRIGLTVKLVFDRNSENVAPNEGSIICRPSKELIGDNTVVITSTKFCVEIIDDIHKMSRKINFILWDDVEKNLIKRLYGKDFEMAYYETI